MVPRADASAECIAPIAFTGGALSEIVYDCIAKVTHGTKCDCEQLDAHCEFGFWFELAAKFSLVLPLLWTSIFFFYAIGDGIHRAVDETFLSIGLSGLYYLAYFLFTYAVVAAKER